MAKTSRNKKYALYDGFVPNEVSVGQGAQQTNFTSTEDNFQVDKPVIVNGTVTIVDATSSDQAVSKGQLDEVNQSLSDTIEELSQSVAGSVQDLTQAISDEKSAREQADSDLQTNIDKEASTRQSEDASLLSNINTRLVRSDGTTTNDQAYVKLADGSQSMVDIVVSGTANTIVKRDSAGHVKTAAPSSDNDAATKHYVDAAVEQIDAEAVALQDALNSEISRAIAAEVANAQAIANETTARQQAVSDLQSSLSSETSARELADTALQGSIESEISAREAADQVINTTLSELQSGKLDKTFAGALVTNISYSYSSTDDSSKLVVSVINPSSNQMSTVNVTIPKATASQPGLMTKESVTTLSQLINRVSALEGKQYRYLYTASSSPTAEEINTFVLSQGGVSPFSGVEVIVEGTMHIWRYYQNDNIGWRDDGIDTVNTATQTTLGVVQGSIENGKVFVEDNGTMSMNGYDALVNADSTNAQAIASETTSRQQADTALQTGKLDKVTSTTTSPQVYAKLTDGSQSMVPYTSSNTASTIVQRDASGRISVGTPTDSSNATTKQYVDSQVSSETTRATAAEEALDSGKVSVQEGYGLYPTTGQVYTSEAKAKLSGIAQGAQVNVLEGITISHGAPSPEGSLQISGKIAGLSIPATPSDIEATPDDVSIVASGSTTALYKITYDSRGRILTAQAAQSADIPGLSSKATDTDVVHIAGAETITGAKTFSSQIVAPSISLGGSVISGTSSSISIPAATVGLANRVNVTNSSISPVTTSTMSLGTSSLRYTNLYLSGKINSLTLPSSGTLATTSDITATNLSGIVPVSKGGTGVNAFGNNNSLVITGSTPTSNLTTLQSGPSGYLLRSTGPSGNLEWVSADTIIGSKVSGVKGQAESSYRTGNVNLTLANLGLSLNGSIVTGNASIYAPTDAGTLGMVLKSSGSSAPEWGSLTAEELGAYEKPVNGIPESDLSSSLQYKINNAIQKSPNLLTSDVTVVYSASTSGQVVSETGYSLGLIVGKKYDITYTDNGIEKTATGKAVSIDGMLALAGENYSDEAQEWINIDDSLFFYGADGINSSYQPADDFLFIVDGSSSTERTIVFKSISEASTVIADKVKNLLKINVNGTAYNYDGSVETEINIETGGGSTAENLLQSSVTANRQAGVTEGDMVNLGYALGLEEGKMYTVKYKFNGSDIVATAKYEAAIEGVLEGATLALCQSVSAEGETMAMPMLLGVQDYNASLEDYQSAVINYGMLFIVDKHQITGDAIYTADENNSSVYPRALQSANAQNAVTVELTSIEPFVEIVADKAIADGEGNNIVSTYAKQNGSYSDMSVGNATNIIPDSNGAVNPGGRGSGTVGINSTALGNSAKAGSDYSTALGNNAKVTIGADYSTALGNGASASGNNSIALGNYASASGPYSTALGDNASVSGSTSIALGYGAIANSDYSTVLGSNASASAGASYSIALGYSAKASAIHSIALGSNVTASGLTSISLGANASASGGASIALGSSASTNGSNSAALGSGASATGASSIALGYTVSASANKSTALGSNTIASGNNSIALGSNTTAGGIGSTALGTDASADGDFSTALGCGTSASGSYSTALGNAASTSESDSMVIQLGNTSLSTLRCRVNLTVTSDKRDKADINNITNALQFIEKLNPVTFVSNDRVNYISEEDKQSEKFRKYGMCDYDRVAHSQGIKKGERRRCGLLAQEVVAAMQEVYGTDNYANIVNDNFHDLQEKPSDVENKYTLAYANLVPFLISAIKELNAEIKILKDKLNDNN